MNEKRKQWMLIGLCVVGAIFAADWGVKNFYDAPLENAEKTTKRLEKALEQANAQLEADEDRIATLKKWEQRSLPSDLELARSAYQQWILELMTAAQFESPAVDVTRPQTRNGVSKFVITLRGRGSMQQCIEFMHGFYRGGHLQKLRQFSMTPQAEQDLIDLSATIEALSLASAAASDTLTSVASEEVGSQDPATYSPLVQSGFLGQGLARELELTRLTGITGDASGSLQAWFTVGKDSQARIHSAGEQLKAGACLIDVSMVSQDQAIVSFNNQPIELAIGDSIADGLRKKLHPTTEPKQN
jgi:hypothetical protein